MAEYMPHNTSFSTPCTSTSRGQATNRRKTTTSIVVEKKSSRIWAPFIHAKITHEKNRSNPFRHRCTKTHTSASAAAKPRGSNEIDGRFSPQWGGCSARSMSRWKALDYLDLSQFSQFCTAFVHTYIDRTLSVVENIDRGISVAPPPRGFLKG